MYYIFADGQLLYSSVQQENALVLSPAGNMEVGMAGSVDFVMLPGHYLYFVIKKLKTIITVFMDSEEIFHGRILNWDTDFYGQRTVHCEGNLAYLLDSAQPPRDANMTPVEFLTACISEHNLQVDVEKRFTIGTISVTSLPITDVLFSNGTYRDTRDTINSDLINVYGGILRTRTVGATTYIDYISSYGSQSTQTLQFGSNILDLSENVSASEVFTVLLPTGDAVESGVEGVPSWPLTIESVNSGSKLLEHAGGIAKFGRIVQTENFSGMTTPTALKAAAEAYFLRVYKEPPITFTVKALDLKLLGVSVEGLKVGKTYHVISPPHTIDGILTCLAINYDFENVENTTLTIGDLVTTPKERSLAGTGGASGGTLSKAVGTAVGGKSGGTVGQALKYYTEGDNLATIAAKKIQFLGEQVLTKITIGDDIAAIINADLNGVQIFGKRLEFFGENGVKFGAGGHIDKDGKFIFDDIYGILGIGPDGTLNYELVNNKNIRAKLNMSEEGVQIYGKNLEFFGENGVKFGAGGHIDKDGKFIFDDIYGILGISPDGTLNYELVNNKNIRAKINASEEGVQILGKNLEFFGENGVKFGAGGRIDKDGNFIFNDIYGILGISPEGVLNYELVNNKNIRAKINASEEGVQILGKNLEFFGENGVQFAAGGYIGKDGKFIFDDLYAKLGITPEGGLNFEVVNDKNVVTKINASLEGVTIWGEKVTIAGPKGIIAEGNLAVANLFVTNATFENFTTIGALADWLQTGSIGAGIVDTGELYADVIGLNGTDLATTLSGKAASVHEHSSYDHAFTAETGANVYNGISVSNGIVTGVSLRALTPEDIGALAVGGKAADSHLLDGYHAADFLGAGYANNISNLETNVAGKLGSGAQAVDSAKLGGQLPAAFLGAGYANNISNLETSVAGKAASGHTHDYSGSFLGIGYANNISNLETNVAGKLGSGAQAVDSAKLGGQLPAYYSISGHGHDYSGTFLGIGYANNISNLETSVAGKAASGHDHAGVYLPLSGGHLTGNLTTSGTISGAVWNSDYAEYFESDEQYVGGTIVADTSNNYVTKAHKRLMKGCHIVSDNFGMIIGLPKNSVPVALTGRILASADKSISKMKTGDAVCSGKNGTISKMNRLECILFPDKIIGVVSCIPKEEEWHGIKINGRVLISV